MQELCQRKWEYDYHGNMISQGSGGVTIPGSVQEVSGWGARRYGLVACGSNGNDSWTRWSCRSFPTLWFYDSKLKAHSI